MRRATLSMNASQSSPAFAMAASRATTARYFARPCAARSRPIATTRPSMSSKRPSGCSSAQARKASAVKVRGPGCVVIVFRPVAEVMIARSGPETTGR